MAIGILVASGQLDTDRLGDTGLIGEVARDGSLRSVPGAMALVAAVHAAGVREVVVPVDNGPEAAHRATLISYGSRPRSSAAPAPARCVTAQRTGALH